MSEQTFERRRETAKRMVAQGYLRETADGHVILTRRGKQALEQFTGGPLARDSFDLDSAYYGTVHANRRREVEWAEKVLNGDEEAVQPKPESTVYWMRHFHEIDEPSLERLYLGGWESVTCWRLDVHRAVAEHARKTAHVRMLIFALYCEGWDRDEIGQLMHSMTPSQEWSPYTVNDRIKELSRNIRRRADMHTPAKGFRDEDLAPTSLAHRTEDAIFWAREVANKPRRKRAAA